VPRQVAGPSSGTSSSSNFGEQARSLDELAILSLLFSFALSIIFGPYAFGHFPGVGLSV